VSGLVWTLPLGRVRVQPVFCIRCGRQQAYHPHLVFGVGLVGRLTWVARTAGVSARTRRGRPWIALTGCDVAVVYHECLYGMVHAPSGRHWSHNQRLPYDDTDPVDGICMVRLASMTMRVRNGCVYGQEQRRKQKK